MHPNVLNSHHILLSVQFLTVHCTVQFFWRLVHDRGCDTPTQRHALWTRGLKRLFQKLVLLTDSILFQVPCCHRTCLSRPRRVFWLVAWGTACFQSSGDSFHYYKHLVLALAHLWQCDTITLPGHPIFIFQPSFSIPERLYPLGLLNCSACFIFMDDLHNSVHYQVHLLIMSPYTCCISSLMVCSIMGPSN